VRLPISTPVRLFPAVGRWGSPRRCAHPHGDAHQQNHRRKKKKHLDGWLSTATASRKPCSLQRKRRAFRVACTCFFWNNWESDNYSECPLVLLPQHPSRMHRKEYGRLPFLRIPELFHVSARLRFRVVDHVSTPRRKAAHTSTDTHHVRR
jgi:hypothetical protein